MSGIWKTLERVKLLLQLVVAIAAAIPILMAVSAIIRGGLEAAVPAWMLLGAALVALAAGYLLGRTTVKRRASSPPPPIEAESGPPVEEAKTHAIVPKPKVSLSEAMRQITHHDSGRARVTLKKHVSNGEVIHWLKRVAELLDSYRLATGVPENEVFDALPVKGAFVTPSEVPRENLERLCRMVEAACDDDRLAVLAAVRGALTQRVDERSWENM